MLIIIVLGSILGGIATATESAAVGAVGAIILAFARKQFTLDNLRQTVRETAKVSSMVFTILIGATIFTLVFRGMGGDDVVHELLGGLPGGIFTAMLVTMLVMFVLGFFLDFIEIVFVVVPIVAPILLTLGADPGWLAIMIAINLQTSFLTPPFGFALFYLRGVAPKSVLTSDIYKGVIPFVAIQLIVLAILAIFPQLATKLPQVVYGKEQNLMQIEVDDYS
jgi:tripartite ATP-independent transporter DctM subunit